MCFVPLSDTLTPMKSCMSSLAPILAGALVLIPCPGRAAPPDSANAAFDAYAGRVESRLAAQHASPDRFLVLAAGVPRSIETAPLIEHLAAPELRGALLHHWRATQFVPRARVADLDRLLRNVAAYPALFAPEVERASANVESPAHLRVAMRVRQKHVITAVLDTSYDVTFGQLDARHRFSASRSTQIDEIGSPGTHAEAALPPDQDHGFLWRQNTYWSYEERDGGLYIQVESLSLTRSIPAGLGWAVAPYVESIPRDSLEFTLRCIRAALLRGPSTAPFATALGRRPPQ